MIAIVTLLVAFPLGLVLRNRLTAFVAFLAAYLYAFTFQTGYLTRSWVQGDDSAFPRQADFGLGYLAVTTAILAVGCALVVPRPPPRHAAPQPLRLRRPRRPLIHLTKETLVSRTSLTVALAGAAIAMAACSSTPAASPAAPARDTAAACAQLITMDAAAVAYPGADPDSPPPSAEALQQWAATMAPPFAVVAAGVPAELDPAVATLRTVLDGVARGTPLNPEDQALTSATTALDKWGHEGCGFTRLDVTGNGKDLPGVPATLPAGPLSISFDNGGNPAQAGFVLLLAKVKDGTTFTLDGIRNGSVDFQSVADVVAAVQPTQGTAYGTAKLEKGRYLVVSPIGAPPSFTGTVAQELVVG